MKTLLALLLLSTSALAADDPGRGRLVFVNEDGTKAFDVDARLSSYDQQDCVVGIHEGKFTLQNCLLSNGDAK